MKPKKLNYEGEEIISIGIDEENEVEATINSGSMGWVLATLSGIYKDSVGAIVREIVSNAYDAHVAEKVDRPVIVGIDDDDSGRYVYVRDFGTGMSTKFFKTRYMSYGDSSKRDTDDEFGMYGIGSKSPLSIFKDYTVITIKDGIKTEWLIYKDVNQDDKPKATLITEEEVEQEELVDIPDDIHDLDHKGTLVKMYLPTEKGFNYVYEYESEFKEAFKIQLKYFTDVYFRDDIVNNDYTVYEFANFRYNDTNQDINSNADISYKRARYPIDWEQLKLTPLKVPVGIKFEIDELIPTPTREDVRYTDDAKEILTKRAKSTAMEIVSRFNKKRELTESLTYFFEKRTDNTLGIINAKNAVDWLKENFEKKVKLCSIEFELFKELDIEPKANLVYNFYRKYFDFYAKPYAALRSGKVFRSYKNIAHLSMRDAYADTWYRIPKNSELDKVKNQYLNNVILIKPIYKLSFSQIKQFIVNVHSHFKFSKEAKKNKREIYRVLFKFFRKMLIENSSSYEQFKVSDEYEQLIREKNRSRSLLEDGEVKVNQVYYATTKTNSTFNMKMDNLLKGNISQMGTMIIGDLKQEKFMYFLDTIIRNRFKYKNGTIEGIGFDWNHLQFISMSTRNKKNVLNLVPEHKKKTIISLEDFFMTKTMRKVATAILLEERSQKLLNEEMFKDINGEVYERTAKVKGYSMQFNLNKQCRFYDKDEAKQFKKELLQEAKFRNLIEYEIVDIVDNLVEYFGDIPLYEFLDQKKVFNPDDSVEEHEYERTYERYCFAMAGYMKLLGKKVDTVFYMTPTEEELRFFRDCQEKELYLLNIQATKLDTWQRRNAKRSWNMVETELPILTTYTDADESSNTVTTTVTIPNNNSSVTTRIVDSNHSATTPY